MPVLRSQLLSSLDWLDHGFGTRHEGSWTPPTETARLRQIHSAATSRVHGPGQCGEGDALVTATAGVWLEIRTADCVPILLADPISRTVAAVHAGWRGTVAGVVKSAIRELTSNPRHLLAAIGPSIGACCFEVGEEVAAQFPAEKIAGAAKSRVDLVKANRRQLVEAGVNPENIDVLGLCTHCDESRFHSFRRDKSDGRMVSAILVR